MAKIEIETHISENENFRFSDEYLSFQEKYWDKPAQFTEDCIKWPIDKRPAPYQLEIQQTLYTEKRKAVRGPHGLGKSALAAQLVLWFALTRDGRDWKIPTTASSWRQLKRYLWPEIRKWAKEIKWDVVGRSPFLMPQELQDMAIRLFTGEAFAVASDRPALIEGAHAAHLLYIFDESKTIPGETFDAAEGAFAQSGSDTDSEAYALSISTPGEPVGRFYDIHSRRPGLSDWKVRHVTKEEAVAAGMISAEWISNRKAQWGEHSALYQNRVEGEFQASDEDAVVPLAWIELAIDKWHEVAENVAVNDRALKAVGVDVASGGRHKSVIAAIYSIQNEKCDYWVSQLNKQDHSTERNVATMATAGRVAGLVGNSRAKISVDAVGVGSGTSHRLREQKKNVFPFIGGAKTDRKDLSGQFRFKDKNAAAWYGLRDLLNPQFGHKIALPPDDELISNLTSRHYTIRSDGVIVVEGKKDLRDRLKLSEVEYSESPDAGDAVCMGFFELFTPVGTGIVVNAPVDAYRKKKRI